MTEPSERSSIQHHAQALIQVDRIVILRRQAESFPRPKRQSELCVPPQTL